MGLVWFGHSDQHGTDSPWAAKEGLELNILCQGRKRCLHVALDSSGHGLGRENSFR